MEGCLKNGEGPCPQLLNLIPKEREWLGKRDDGKSSEEKKLELRLGPPGEDWSLKEAAKNTSSRERDESLFSLGYFNTLNQQAHKFSTPENPQLGPAWFNKQQQQQQQQAKASPSYLQFQSTTAAAAVAAATPQSLPAMANESSQSCCTKVAVDLQKSAEKKAFSPPAPVNTAVPNSSQKRYSSLLIFLHSISLLYF